jgi:DNA-binding HxlR family transcriptional regulator
LKTALTGSVSVATDHLTQKFKATAQSMLLDIRIARAIALVTFKSQVTKVNCKMQVTLNQAAERARPIADSVERALAQVGDSWTFLILREAFFGVRRFDAMLSNLGVSSNILSCRLKKLVEYEILERRQYQDRPARFEYVLTEKGHDLYAISVMLLRWGDDWLAGEAGPPLTLIHKTCGSDSQPQVTCDVCGERVHARDMDWREK